jgi:hypothetical protein
MNGVRDSAPDRSLDRANEEDHGGVAVTVRVALGRLDQPPELVGGCAGRRSSPRKQIPTVVKDVHPPLCYRSQLLGRRVS